MNFTLFFTCIMLLISRTVVYPQQQDSTHNSFNEREQNYTPISLLFSNLNVEDYTDSSLTIKQLPSPEKPNFLKDYIYIIGTVAIAAIIYFLWPEDNPAAQSHLTFGTPPPPK